MKLLVFEAPDGSLMVYTVNEKFRRPFESDDAFIARMAALEGPKNDWIRGLPHHAIDVADLPVTRANRRKWRVKQRGGKPVVEVDPTVQDPGPP